MGGGRGRDGRTEGPGDGGGAAYREPSHRQRRPGLGGSLCLSAAAGDEEGMSATRAAAAHLCRLLYGPPRRVGGGAAAAAAGMRPRAHRGGTWPVATRARKAAGTHCEPGPRSAACADHEDVSCRGQPSWVQTGGGGGARGGWATPWGQRVRVGRGAEGGGATGDNLHGRGHDLHTSREADHNISAKTISQDRYSRTSLVCSFCMKQLP